MRRGSSRGCSSGVCSRACGSSIPADSAVRSSTVSPQLCHAACLPPASALQEQVEGGGASHQQVWIVQVCAGHAVPGLPQLKPPAWQCLLACGAAWALVAAHSALASNPVSTLLLCLSFNPVIGAGVLQ